MDVSRLLAEAGIVGCGGAGFPAHAKYSGEGIKTIIINAAECEPLLQNDCYLMREKSEELLEAADYLFEETGAAECVIALKAEYKREIAALGKAIEGRSSKVRLHEMNSFFPAGDEQTIVFEVTGRVVPPGAIPLNVGCVVSNVATLYCIYNAMKGRACTRRYMTVTGEVGMPSIIKAPIGTPIRACLEACGGVRIPEYIIINGGPMMGKPVFQENVDSTYVTKTMSGLIVLPLTSDYARRIQVSIRHMLNRAKSSCIQCSQCSSMCPRAMLGHPLRPHRIMRKLAMCTDIRDLLDDPDIQNAAICCECGICEIYACPMGLQPRTVNSMLKKELAAAGFRYRGENREYSAEPEREYRKAPTDRVAARAGVYPYEHIQVDRFVELKDVRQVRISLKQNIGAPSEPVVKPGDHVKTGQLIAKQPEGKLGASLHASIDGCIKAVDDCIEIISDCGEV